MIKDLWIIKVHNHSNQKLLDQLRPETHGQQRQGTQGLQGSQCSKGFSRVKNGNLARAKHLTNFTF